jgi:hypothetical protein
MAEDPQARRKIPIVGRIKFKSNEPPASRYPVIVVNATAKVIFTFESSRNTLYDWNFILFSAYKPTPFDSPSLREGRGIGGEFI